MDPIAAVPQWKWILKMGLQVGVSAGCCLWLLGKSSVRLQLAPTLASADRSWIVAAFAVYATVELFAAIRWQFLLRDHGLQLSWRRSTAILFLSVFVNTILPGLIGGDAVRFVLF